MSELDVKRDNSNPGRNPITKEHVERSRLAVVSASKLGCTDREIGTIVGMSEDSVKRHLRKELDEGRTALAGGLRKAQVEAAIKDKNPTMLIWLGKQYLGQREPKQTLEHTGGVTIEKKVFHPNAKKN